jgi:hypothetical protein
MINILTLILMVPVAAKTPTFELEQELHCSNQALPMAGEAFVKHFNIDKKVQRLQKRYVPKDIEPYVGTGIAIHEIIVNKRLNWRWEF